MDKLTMDKKIMENTTELSKFNFTDDGDDDDLIIDCIILHQVFPSVIARTIEMFCDRYEIYYFNWKKPGDMIPSLAFATEEQLSDMILKNINQKQIINRACEIGTFHIIENADYSNYKPEDITEHVLHVVCKHNTHQILDFLYLKMLDLCHTIRDLFPFYKCDSYDKFSIQSLESYFWFDKKELLHSLQDNLFTIALQSNDETFMNFIDTYINNQYKPPTQNYETIILECLQKNFITGYIWLLENKFKTNFEKNQSWLTKQFMNYGSYLYGSSVCHFKRIYPFFKDQIKKQFEHNFGLSKCSGEIYFWILQKLNAKVNIVSILKIAISQPKDDMFRIAIFLLQKTKNQNLFENLPSDKLLELIHIGARKKLQPRNLHFIEYILDQNKETVQSLFLDIDPYFKSKFDHFSLDGILWFFNRGGKITDKNILEHIHYNQWNDYDNPLLLLKLLNEKKWSLTKKIVDSLLTLGDAILFCTVVQFFKDLNLHVDDDITFQLSEIKFKNEQEFDVFLTLMDYLKFQPTYRDIYNIRYLQPNGNDDGVRDDDDDISDYDCGFGDHDDDSDDTDEDEYKNNNPNHDKNKTFNKIQNAVSITNYSQKNKFQKCMIQSRHYDQLIDRIDLLRVLKSVFMSNNSELLSLIIKRRRKEMEENLSTVIGYAQYNNQIFFHHEIQCVFIEEFYVQLKSFPYAKQFKMYFDFMDRKYGKNNQSSCVRFVSCSN